ncbi:MAG: TIGR01212 family radical SAM protein [Planctomycetia bacterium]|nr:TIGR01212 family radical SAM protein [Planctomycetia bacterium]
MSKLECDWRSEGHRYFPLGMAMRKEFGEAVWKISVDAHFSCPNVDGTVGTGGCIFCNTHSFSPGRRMGLESITDQIETGIRQLQRRHHVNKYIAYFQPSTNTYAPLDYLKKVFEEALNHPQIAGLAIGTRPDAVPDKILDYLANLSQNHWISLEIGIQSTKDESLRFLRRGHDFSCCEDAIRRITERRIRLGIHLILGIPGETREDLLRTAKIVGSWDLSSIKFHHLYIVKNTPLADLWEEGKIQLPSCSEYVEMVIDCLERLSPETVIDRLSGDMSPEYLIAPSWTAEKHRARQLIEKRLIERDTWQGKFHKMD